MKKFLRIGVLSLALALLPFIGGGASAMNWRDVFGGTPSVSTTPIQAVRNSDDTEHPCLRYINHEYEVCSAYIVNASLAVLAPYYKYANSDESWSRYVIYRLGSRYTGSAYDIIQSRVAGWPAGKDDVDMPRIEVLSVSSSLATNSATLATKETWRVRSSNGTTLYQETDQQHIVTMRRVPSYVLHKWVVTDIR